MSDATAREPPSNRSEPVEYPHSDGLPWAESPRHLEEVFSARHALIVHLSRHRSDFYVGTNTFIYYKEGDPSAVVSPDAFVALGVAGEERHSYKAWESGKVPDFVLDVTSRSRHSEEEKQKRSTYAAIGMQEYWRFDPLADPSDSRLEAFGLEGGKYGLLPPCGEESFRSKVLGLEIRVKDGSLRMRDLATGEDIRSALEMHRALEQRERTRLAVEAALETVNKILAKPCPTDADFRAIEAIIAAADRALAGKQ